MSNLSRYVPGAKLIDAKTAKAPQVYKGSDADEDFAVLDVAFWKRAVVLSADYRMLAKAKKYHKYVEGHADDRCLNGVIILPIGEIEQQKLLDAFLVGRRRVPVPFYEKTKLNADWDLVADWNLGVNLRADRPHAIPLCDCERIE